MSHVVHMSENPTPETAVPLRVADHATGRLEILRVSFLEIEKEGRLW